MPVLTVRSFVRHSLYYLILLVQKTELCPQAKVAHTQEANLLEHIFSCELNNGRVRWEEILKCQWRNLHNIAYIETVYPLVLIQVA